jgi:hypothetical protein
MIATKSEFLRLWNAGRLGNKLRTWDRIDDAVGYEGRFGIRSRRPGSINTTYGVSREDVPAAVARMVSLGEGAGDLYFGEMAPDHRLLIQGEFFHAAGFNRHLMYSTEQVPMKRVAAWSHTDGVSAAVILRSYMSPGSWDDFEALQERYPDHVIEFGCYECDLGDVPGRNTIIWEVRSY